MPTDDKQLAGLYRKVERAVITKKAKGCTKDAIRQLAQRGERGVRFKSESQARCCVGFAHCLDMNIAVGTHEKKWFVLRLKTD